MEKIAFVGTSCTGKTVTFEHYRSKFAGNPKVGFADEAAREYLSKHPDMIDNPAVSAPWGIGALTIEKEKAVHTKGVEIIICDRSVLDPVPYLAEQQSKKEADKLLKHIDHWLPSYTGFLLFNPDDVPYQTDDIRKDAFDSRQRVHEYFLGLFSDLQLPYSFISGTFNERIEKIDRILDPSFKSLGK